MDASHLRWKGVGLGRSCPPRRLPVVIEGPPARSAVDNWTLGTHQAEGEGGPSRAYGINVPKVEE